MKNLKIFGLTLFLLSSLSALGNSDKLITCKVKTGDIGTIMGVGTDKFKAYEDAAEKCFDKRSAMFETLRKKKLSTDRGLDFIDACTNISCG